MSKNEDEHFGYMLVECILNDTQYIAESRGIIN